jgi:hypothetical protein
MGRWGGVNSPPCFRAIQQIKEMAMDDYYSNVKDCPIGITIAGISSTGMNIIGRRSNANAKKDHRNGKTVNVSRLHPITGRKIGTVNIVKWKPFDGKFDIKNLPDHSVKIISSTEKKYGFPDAIMVGKALKKYKISSGVAYRWMHENILEYRMVGKNRYVPRGKFAELAANHSDKRRGKPKKKASVPAVIPAYVVPPKRWWQFWKNKNN